MTYRLHRCSPLAAAWLSGALVIGTAATSRAEEGQAESVAAARSLGIQGVQLADAGKCPEAIEKLERAESLYHAPTILVRLGECRVNVGQVVQGTEDLNRVVREVLPANAPKAFHDAQDRAQKVLAAATPKIARLTVKVDPPDAKPTVTVSGKQIPAALIGVERPTDPGAHEVAASAPGYLTAQQTVTLAEGGQQEITLKLVKDPNAGVIVPAPGAVPAAQPPGGPAQPPMPGQPPLGAPPAHGGHTLAYVALGVGGAAVVVGAITGVMAMSKAGDCKNKICSSQSTLDSAKSMATISTVGFGVGLAGIALGTILLVTGKSEIPPAAQMTAKHDTPPRWSIQPWLGLNTAGVTGAFQ
jgi:hypothetical protein